MSLAGYRQIFQRCCPFCPKTFFFIYFSVQVQDSFETGPRLSRVWEKAGCDAQQKRELFRGILYSGSECANGENQARVLYNLVRLLVLQLS